MAASIKDQLKGLSKTWKKTKPKESGGFSEAPDGTYPSVCKQGRLENAKSSGRLQIAWMFRVKKDPQKGRAIYIYTGLETEDNLGWCKGIFLSMGVKPPKNIVNLTDKLEKCLEKDADIVVSTSGQFTNKYVNPPGKSSEEQEDEEDVDLEEL